MSITHTLLQIEKRDAKSDISSCSTTLTHPQETQDSSKKNVSGQNGKACAKKKVLLIHPMGECWIAGEKDVSRIANIMPPLGLCSLAAWVEQHGHQAFIHDCYAHPGDYEKIYDFVRTEQPEFVGFTATTSAFLEGIRIVEKIKAIAPNTTIICGGAHISALRESLMKDYPVLDFGVVGEGENTLLFLMQQDLQGSEVSGPLEQHGLLYRQNEQVVFTGFLPRQEALDLDALPYPAYEKLAGFPDAYNLPIFNYPKGPGTTIVSSRGCPYTCSYCDRTVFKSSFRYNSPEYMLKMMLHLKERYGIRHINFYDDLFTLHKKRVIGFCNLMIERKPGVTFNCAVRAEHIDLDLLKLMKKAGCWMISLGIETGDPELLKLHRSNSDLEMIRSKVKLIKQAGIRTKGLFIMGLPGETEESIDRTFNYALELPLDDLNLAKYTPFPGAPSYEGVREHGTFNEDWELMNCVNFVFIPNGLTKERMEVRYKEFYYRHHSRFHILFDYFTMLWRSPHSWYRLLRNFKDFWRVRKNFVATVRESSEADCLPG